jgi:hypothetical protein
MGRFLFEFTYKRTASEAIGFYLSHFIIGLLLGAVMGAIMGSLGLIQYVLICAATLAGLYSATLTHRVISQRQLNSGLYFLVPLAVVLGVLFGMLGGLIPCTILLTRNQPEVNNQEKKD